MKIPKPIRRAAKRLYRALLAPETRTKVEKYAKTIVASTGTFLQIVNYVQPAYDDKARSIVGIVVGIGTVLGVRQVPNRRTPAR
jgi:hypothetical protein